MTAPAPTPAEQAVIDRFGIFDEERVVEVVARAIYATWKEVLATWEGSPLPMPSDEVAAHLAAAAVAAYRATQDGGAEEAVRRVEALHTPVQWFEEVEPGDEVFDPTKPLGAFCRECTDDEYVEAVEGGYAIDQGSPVVYWPCPTIAALAPQAGDGAK